MIYIQHSHNGYATYLADNAYLAIEAEATAGVAVIPAKFIPLVSESIRTVVNHSADQRFKGLSWKSNALLRGNRQHEGEIVVLGDPDTLGHFLNMVMKKGSTTGSAPDGFTHPFTVGDPKSYTFEIKTGNFVRRYFGVKVDQLNIEFADGQMQLTASIKAQGQVSVAKLGVALTGIGMVELVLDDEYDVAPTNGFVIGDVITVGGVDVTLTGITDDVTLAFTAEEITASVGDDVILKPLTVTQPTLSDPLYFGNLLVGLGVDETAATTAAGSRANATAIYDLVISIKNNLFAENGTTRFDPIQLIPRTKEAQITLKQLLTGEGNRSDWLNRTKQAITIIASGKYIKSDFTTKELLTFKFHNVKLLDNVNALEVGELIADEQEFEVLYDDSDAKAMTADLVNNTDGTDYV